MNIDEKKKIIMQYMIENAPDHLPEYKQVFNTENHKYRFNIDGAIRMLELSDNFMNDHQVDYIIRQIKALRIIESLLKGEGNYILTNKGVLKS
jgi:hypothetical protein